MDGTRLTSYFPGNQVISAMAKPSPPAAPAPRANGTLKPETSAPPPASAAPAAAPLRNLSNFTLFPSLPHK